MAEIGALAPIGPPESNILTRELIRPVFRQGYTDTLHEVRGIGVSDDMDPNITPGYRYAIQRDAVAGREYYQGKRGQMSDIPTPQELIRRVTGVGSVPRGR